MNKPEIETAAATAKPEVLTPTMAKLLVERDRLRQERDALADALRPLLDAHKDEAHSMPGEAWGYDAAGIHGWEPDEPQGCPICVALDAARAALDRHTHQDKPGPPPQPQVKKPPGRWP